MNAARFVLSLVMLTGLLSPCMAQELDAELFSRTGDVVYGRKYGTALTMDVFQPKKNSNKAALIFAVSGGWFSSHRAINPGFTREFLKRGYTVFAVVHGSQPKFDITEVLKDMHRSVRYIRFHAEDYNIDPDRIGIYGGSAGGHLSLMQGTAGDLGNPNSKDSVDKLSSRVQAVACFFPPTDFLNYGKPGEEVLGTGLLKNFKAPFDFKEFDSKTRSLIAITDPERRRIIGKDISPVYHVSKDDPPTLIIHGDADQLVPIQQAELIISRFKDAGVPSELIVKKGAGHGWKKLTDDLVSMADWFDKYLARSGSNQ
ncbi:MAG: alpha/beta hydrolase [Planctomycetes bacterium]|nr:alpha/beta hydrolase [Planctomycetota bacterium]